MTKVLRGGRWGSGSRDSSARAQADFRASTDGTVALGDDDELAGVIVALLEERRELGVACYDLSSNEVYIAKVPSEEGYGDATKVVQQQDTRIVVLPTSYAWNNDLLSALRVGSPSCGSATPDSNAEVPALGNSSPTGSRPQSAATNNKVEERGHTIRYIANCDFGRTRAVELCSLLTIRGMPSNLDSEGRFRYLSHLIGEEECILRAMGGLLSLILRDGILGISRNDSESIAINEVKFRNYCSVMKVSPTTLRALNVFCRDVHPVGQSNMVSKEGLSLYGILKTHVTTASARKLLRGWLLYPSTDLDTVEKRQRVVDFLQQGSNSAVLFTLREALRGVRNVPGVLRRLKTFTASVTDWKALYASLKCFLTIFDTLGIALRRSAELGHSSVLSKISKIADKDLRDCVGWIDAVVDFEESLGSGRMVVEQGFDEEIDEMKRCYSGLDAFLTSVGVQEYASLMQSDASLSLSSLRFTYQPQIGYLAILSSDDCDRVGLEALRKVGMSFVFSALDEGLHFKTKRCMQLDDELGDIHGAIIDLEAKAIRRLEGKVHSYSGTIFEMAVLVRELDCLQGFACAANEYTWSKPTLEPDGEGLIIEDGRHPIVELVVSFFVPNTTRLNFGDVHVLTGPNYSGKSVYLMQIAMVVILTQIGSFVPARRANMSIVESISSRVGSFESIAHGQSSFFMDSCQVSSMLSPRPGKSLQIIDEFGKGTAELDGMALLAAALQRILAEPVATAPLCICVTHFAEIFKEPLLPLSNPRLAVFSMEVLNRQVNRTVGHNPEESNARLLSLSQQIGPGGFETMKPLSNTASLVRKKDGCDEREQLGNIVRTYKLLAGSICHESRALQCALEVGVPRFLLERAAHVRDAISGGKTIESTVVAAKTNGRIRACANGVRKFLQSEFKRGGGENGDLNGPEP